MTLKFKPQSICIVSLLGFLLFLMSFWTSLSGSSASDSQLHDPNSSSKLENEATDKLEGQSVIFSFQQTSLNPPMEGFIIQPYVNNVPMTYLQFLTNLKMGDAQFVELLSGFISSKYEAVFWECNHITKASLPSKPIQFVVLNSRSLANIRLCNPQPFLEHFSACNIHENGVVSFENLGKDAVLVVPCPPSLRSAEHNHHMAHLASFHRNASKDHIMALWRKAGEVMLNRIDAQPDPEHRFWLSTSGLGVSWLHIRIDDVPKYYNWRDFKQGLS